MQVPFVYNFLPFRGTKVIVLIGAVLVLVLAGFSMFYFVTGFANLVRNRTLIEVWGKTASARFNRGCCRNFADVCGEKWCCCMWPCPFVCLNPLWDGIDPVIAGPENDGA
jgi:hypothetical protein